MNCLSPSILAADISNLGKQIRLLDEVGAQYVHIDVMDGQFVPSLSFGLPVVRSIRPLTERILDVHLMVLEPERYIGDFVEAGADLITVHAEACTHLHRTIHEIKKRGALASVALNPATPLNALDYVLEDLDMVLIMSVNPGYGGQDFIPSTSRKLSELREMIRRTGKPIDVEVDGGVTLKNVRQIMDAGANVIVSGSAVFKGDIRKNAAAFLSLMSE